MVRMQVRLTAEQVQALRKRAAEEGVSMAELVRRGIQLYLQNCKKPDKAEFCRRVLEVAGRFSSGLGDVSERHDDYFAEACEHNWDANADQGAAG